VPVVEEDGLQLPLVMPDAVEAERCLDLGDLVPVLVDVSARAEPLDDEEELD
jgi:hypothetical protein